MLSEKQKKEVVVVWHGAWIRSTRQHIAELKEHREFLRGSGSSPANSASLEEYYRRRLDRAIAQLESVVDLVEGVARAKRS